MTTTFTAEQIQAIGGSPWHKDDGTLRVYLNDWVQFIGLEVSRYKSGNISSATLNGQPISNGKAARLLAAKVYWEGGTIHITRGSVAEDYRDELLAGIANAVARVTA